MARDRLAGMSAATIDRRLTGERRKLQIKDGPGRNRLLAETADPDPHLGGLGRRHSRVRRDRPGRSRGRQPVWGVLPDPDRDGLLATATIKP